MTKLYIFPDDIYDDKPENGDTIAGSLYESIQDMIEGEGLGDDIDGDEYTVIAIDTDDFKKVVFHRSKVTYDEKPRYPVKKGKKKGG